MSKVIHSDQYELMQKKILQLKENWGLGEEESWSLDQESRTISFKFADGKTIMAKVQIIGTYDIQEQKFLWAWANASLQEDLKVDALRLRDKLRERRLDQWLPEELPIPEEDAMFLTYLAAYYNKADGFHAGRVRDTLLQMTFSGINIRYEDDILEEMDASYKFLPGVEISDPSLMKFVQDYMGKMYLVDKAFHEQSKTIRSKEYPGLVEAHLKRQEELYLSHWHRTDDHHKPCSLHWPSEYALENTRDWAMYELGDDIYKVTYLETASTPRTNAFFIEKINGEWKIIDFEYNLKVGDAN